MAVRKRGKRLVLARIDKNWFQKSETIRERVCAAMCSTEEPEHPHRIRTGGNCEVLRWTDGREICEQWVCYDPMGMIVDIGPVVCRRMGP